MSFGRFFRVLLAAAMLSAQCAALAHEIWHAEAGKSQPAQKQLCTQHDALGTVAGGLHTAAAQLPQESPASAAPRFQAMPEAAAPGLAPSSRGPPASL